ncbi:MAG: fibronectin type III domain-containing protein [bacterium]
MQNARPLPFVAGVLFLSMLPASSTKSVIVSWDANREDDLAGYRVYVGERSGQYQQDVYVGNVTSHRVSGLEPNQRYYFVVTALDHAGNESGFSEEVDILTPEDSEGDGDGGDPPDPASDGSRTLSPLAYNFPNPFRVSREATTIRYELLSPGEITIQILDANTNLVKTIVKNQLKRAGEHIEDRWDGTNRHGQYVANGVYFCNIRTDNEQAMIKIAITR